MMAAAWVRFPDGYQQEAVNCFGNSLTRKRTSPTYASLHSDTDYMKNLRV